MSARSGRQGHALRGSGHDARARRHLLLPGAAGRAGAHRLDQPGRAQPRLRAADRPAGRRLRRGHVLRAARVEPRPPRVVHVCEDLACRCNGSQELIAQLEEHFGAEGELDRPTARRPGSAARASASATARPPRMLTVAGDAAGASTCSRRSTPATVLAGDRRAASRRGRPRDRRCRRQARSPCACCSRASATSIRRASTTTARRAATRRCGARSSSAPEGVIRELKDSQPDGPRRRGVPDRRQVGGRRAPGRRGRTT